MAKPDCLESVGNGPIDTHRFQTSATVAARTPWGYVGIVDHYQNQSGFYIFVVDGQGRFQVLLDKDSALTALQPWTKADYLNPAGTANVLAVEDDGQTLRFYGNNMLLYEIKQIDLPAGDVGLVGGAQERGAAEVQFDWLQLYDIVR